MKSTLTLGDGFVGVSPFPESLLSRLHYWKRVMGYNEGKHRREITSHDEVLYRIESGAGPDGRPVSTCFTLPGFAKRCKDHLVASGYEVEVVDRRTPLPEPDWFAAMHGLRNYQQPLVYAMIMNGGGILAGATGLGKSYVIKALCAAYPHESMRFRGTPTIVVAVPDKDITRQDYEALARLLPDRNVGLVMSGSRKFSEDIQVVTLDSLHLLNANDVGIVIVDEMHTASSDTRSSELLRFSKARFWGVSATPDGRFDGKDVVAEGIFGPCVAQFTYQDGVKAGCLVPLKVFWLDAPEPQMGAENYCRYKERDSRYKWGVHNNTPLNKMIGRIFAGIPDSLQALGMLQFTDHMEAVLRGCAEAGVIPMPAQVHAGTDPKKFPPSSYWHVHAVSAKERKDTYDRMKAGELRKAISTFCWKQGVSFDDLRIVVNLCGCGSEIFAKQVPGRASRKAPGKDCAYIIEFRHPWDKKKVKTKAGYTREVAGPVFSDDMSRMKIYSELGFEQINLVSERELPWIHSSSTPTP